MVPEGSSCYSKTARKCYFFRTTPREPHSGIYAMSAEGSIKISRKIHEITWKYRALSFDANFSSFSLVDSLPRDPQIMVCSCAMSSNYIWLQ